MSSTVNYVRIGLWAGVLVFGGLVFLMEWFMFMSMRKESQVGGGVSDVTLAAIAAIASAQFIALYCGARAVSFILREWELVISKKSV